MNLQKFTPKIFAGVAVLGTITTAILAAHETPKAQKLIEQSNATTFKEKVKACWKCYIPAGALCVITVASIISGFNDLMRKNTELALAYGFGQTAIRLYSERAPEVRQQVTAEMMRMQEPPKENYIQTKIDADPKDQINLYYDYYGSRFFHTSTNEIEHAIEEFTETVLNQNGRGNLNQLYSCFHNSELPPITLADSVGWKHSDPPRPMISIEPDKYGNPKNILDFYNPPIHDYNNEFA